MFGINYILHDYLTFLLGIIMTVLLSESLMFFALNKRHDQTCIVLAFTNVKYMFTFMTLTLNCSCYSIYLVFLCSLNTK